MSNDEKAVRLAIEVVRQAALDGNDPSDVRVRKVADDADAALTALLRAALARAERAEALVREAGVMLKKCEYEAGYEDYACPACWSKPHEDGCPYAALLARIAELEKP